MGHDINHPNPALPVEEIFHESPAYFQDLLAGINAAQQSIDLEVYIYERQGIGEQISHALTQASQRGVHIRILVDGIGIDSRFEELADTLQNANIQVRIFRPLPWRLQHWRFAVAKEHGLSKLWYLLSFLNRRNHRKMILIDEKRIWLGSVNVSQAHLPFDPSLPGWRDTAIRISNAELALPKEAFELAWNRSRPSHQQRIAHQLESSLFLLNFTRYLRLRNQRSLLYRVLTAQKRIWVTNAYFAPTNALVRALETAAGRGVDVRILLPAKSDVSFMPWVSAFFYRRLIKKNVRVYEYLPSMLHCKSLIIDDWACLGSSNLNRRSLINDLEIDYPVQQADSLKELEQRFGQDLELSSLLSLKDTARMTRFWKRWVGGLLLLLLGRWL